VNDYITGEGIREYESIFFFSKRYVLEAKQFINAEIMDVAPLKFGYVEMQLQNYVLKEPADNSRMILNAFFISAYTSSRGFMLRASRENCVYLVKIFETYIKPNLEG
jgi:hypothetical protein